MKFPITRKDLQSFDIDKDREELKEEAIQLKITQIVEQICKEFKQSIYRHDGSCRHIKKFVWHKLQDTNMNHFNILGVMYEIKKLDTFIPQLIDKLREVFIGCDIIIDPLQTYIIIDWS